LLTEHERGRQVVVVLDEAHTIPVEHLERLVRLSHVRALTGEPLLQMLLIGLGSAHLRRESGLHPASFTAGWGW
jgi:hypothetical protein